MNDLDSSLRWNDGGVVLLEEAIRKAGGNTRTVVPAKAGTQCVPRTSK